MLGHRTSYYSVRVATLKLSRRVHSLLVVRWLPREKELHRRMSWTLGKLQTNYCFVLLGMMFRQIVHLTVERSRFASVRRLQMEMLRLKDLRTALMRMDCSYIQMLAKTQGMCKEARSCDYPVDEVEILKPRLGFAPLPNIVMSVRECRKGEEGMTLRPGLHGTSDWECISRCSSNLKSRGERVWLGI
jgi:hypothetical protein